MVMDGLDSMSKAELLILCEKHKIDGGKTVAQMRYALKKLFDDADQQPPDAKKLKVDPLCLKGGTVALTSVAAATTSSAVVACTAGEMCPNLYSMSHRTSLRHGGEYRDAPYLCREGMSCPALRDKEHLKKYAHDDSSLCKLGGDCPELHLMEHRKNFEHLGFRRFPCLCRDGLTCAQLKDKGHLFKYAHDGPTAAASATTPTALVTAASTAVAAVPSVVSTSSSIVLTATAAAGPLAPVHSVTMPSTSSTIASSVSAAESSAYVGKTLDDYPLESAADAELRPVPKDSDEFWELEERFNAHLQGRNEDYVEKRIKEGKKPIRFVLIGADLIVNPVLTARFEIKRRMMIAERGAKECRERVSFHGTHPKNVKSIIKTGLLRFKHPLNPCKTQVDDGYFGTNKKGIYVSRYADYTLKYSNRVCPVDPKDEVKTIMFRTMPGVSFHMEKLVGAVDPTPGYDSHSSPTYLEWYLFDEAQACPHYVLTVRAVEDTRTAADDE